jgi:hypothetical protein
VGEEGDGWGGEARCGRGGSGRISRVGSRLFVFLRWVLKGMASWAGSSRVELAQTLGLISSV